MVLSFFLYSHMRNCKICSL